MSKHRRDPWPVWKIVAVAIVAALAGGVLFWASQAIPPAPVRATATSPATVPAAPVSPDRTPTPADSPSAPVPGRPDSPAASGFGPGLMLLLLALISWAVSVVFAGWLVYKLYMRIPAWRRRQLFGRGR